MADRSQFFRGTLEGCILKVIDQNETYGYEIADRLLAFGFKDISEGTIYPLLLRLEKSGLVISVKRDSALGPKRKYYRLTDAGRHEILEFYSIWSEIRDSIDRVFCNEEETHV